MPLNVHALQGMVEIARHSTQLWLLLHQVNLESLSCQTQRAGHSGDTAANHQTGLVDRQFKLFQWLQARRSRHRHTDDFFGFPGRPGGLFGMHPGAMLTDVGHLEEVLVNAAFAAGVAEKRLMGSGCACRNHHPVEAFFPDRICYFLGIVRGTGKNAFLRMNHIVQGRGVLDNRRHIHDPSDIRAAMAYENADFRLFTGFITFRWVDPIPGQIAAAVGQKLTAQGIGPAGRDDGLGDIDGALERAADKNTGPRGFDGIGRFVHTELMRIEFNAELLR